ncbi:RNA recognition motif domain-containing protein [Aquisalimonas asiatica]|uniref:RNA recognition motif. (A.k.a. RRM, RBD, or RNP domain) n=1 Tax=Aquisalimonas asiatica TaxID=406100 RepID=A0A1H8PLN2_9GAMM|nr:RNA-binding protein [Aquisalimonas asiatica]SEO42850.1 RNA recognition motif. (a.k.a. RRM, RBD, or RNP domain) [Aquisalimonas asiatica]
MHKTIYVGNLPFSSTEDDVRSLFEAHGTVRSVKLIADRDSGKPRGFGFVQMDADEAEAAIAALNGYELGGRALRINEARQRTGHRVRRPF